MKALIYVLDKIELKQRLLKDLSDNGINNCTVLKGNTMRRELGFPPGLNAKMFTGGLRALLNAPVQNCNVMFMVLNDDEEIKTVTEIIERNVGSLNEQDTGFVFAFELIYDKGIHL